MAQVNAMFVEPLRVDFGCSYIELISEKAQRPEYYVSFASAITFRDFMNAIEWHAEARLLIYS